MAHRTSRSTVGTLVVALLLATGLAGAAPLRAAADESGCADRVLILTAMPLELNPLITALALEEQVTVAAAGEAPRSFYLGDIDGEDVILAMTGVGMVNAEQTTRAAFAKFGTCFRGVLFSGVAGSPHNIGDVDIAEDWTIEGGPGAMPVDAEMYQVAGGLAGTEAVALDQSVPVGDAACLCPGVDAATPVSMPQPAAVHIGGHGTTSDLFGGHAVPCMPGGGDIAGCKPCITTPGFDEDAAAFAENFPTILAPSFIAGFFRGSGTSGDFVSYDMETALVAKVAADSDVPFLGIRAVSDGASDPLHLPGFPAQFMVYRQLAGNNAAAVTIAFLAAWASAGYPTAQTG